MVDCLSEARCFEDSRNRWPARRQDKTLDPIRMFPKRGPKSTVRVAWPARSGPVSRSCRALAWINGEFPGQDSDKGIQRDRVFGRDSRPGGNGACERTMAGILVR